MTILGEELNGAGHSTLVRIREEIGFIFQAHNPIESSGAVQNVEMGLGLKKSISRAEARKLSVRESRSAHRLTNGPIYFKYPYISGLRLTRNGLR
jgi:ABC-type lipoprotein export system ATPase subunit